jgi:two-component system OmpR family response regulator
MPRVLLIDDDEHLAPPLATYLKRFDFELARRGAPAKGWRACAPAASTPPSST